MVVRDRRLDGEAYLTEGFQYRLRIESLPNTQAVKDLARVWQPTRLKGVKVWSTAGLPFLTATQAFDVRPVPRKWLSKAHTPKLNSRYVNAGTILVTCSGNIGDAIIAYKAHEGLVISHDLVRVDPEASNLTGYLYTYFRTRYGRAVMRSSQYGNVIKHMEPEHLETVPVPIFDDDLIQELAADIDGVFQLRTEAHVLSVQAEALYAESVGEPAIDEAALEGFTVESSDLFTGRRRLEAYAHNPLAEAVRALVDASSERASDVVDGIFGVPRFKHVYTTDRSAIPYLDSEDLFKLNPESTKFIPVAAKNDAERYFVSRGWLLMACSGQLYGFNGRVVIADESHEGSIVSNHVLRIIPSAGIRPGYLYVALEHPTLGQPLVLSRAFGTSVPEIDVSDIAGLPVARLGNSIESEIADAAEIASDLRIRAKRKENGAVAKLEKRIDDALLAEAVDLGPVKVNAPFDDAIRRGLQVNLAAGEWTDGRPATRKHRKQG